MLLDGTLYDRVEAGTLGDIQLLEGGSAASFVDEVVRGEGSLARVA